MGERQGDVRVYLISGLFLACSIGGGIFLCIYILLPESESAPWYPIAGMTLVAIPWLFWLLIYVYRCFRFRPIMDVKIVEYHNQGKGIGTPKSATTNVVASPRGAQSPLHSPNGRDCNVHFGAVVVMGNNNGLGGGGGSGVGRKQHGANPMDHHHEDSVEKLAHHESKELATIPSLV